MLMKQSQLISKKNEAHKHIKIQWALIFEKISKFEKRNKVNTIKWRPIYEVTDEPYFIGSKMFSDDFMKECKDNENVA